MITDPDYIDKNGNDIADIQEYNDFLNDINFDWYVKEVEKLVKPLTN